MPDDSHSAASEFRPDISLEVHECWALLRDEAYGRLAVVGRDGPEIFPVNVRVDRGTIAFRTAAGNKLAALRDDPRVAFEVDGYDDVDRTVWSVVIRGVAKLVSDQYDCLDVVELGVTPWQHGPKPEFVRIVPTTVSGRRFERAKRSEWSVPNVHRTTSVD
ncbi:MAG: pyridoxamine 5'-phosphate oxidase family protein [Ilumatobacter sp.]